MTVQRRERGGRVRRVARYRGPDGRERSHTADTRREAQAWLAEREREMRRGEWIDPAVQDVTLTELIAGLTTRARADGTRAHEQFARQNLGPIADTPVRDLRPSMIESWLDKLTRGRPWADESALAPQSAAGALRVVKTALTRPSETDSWRPTPPTGCGHQVWTTTRCCPTWC